MDARQKGAWSFICSEASPLLTPPSAHVAPAAAPALSNSDTAFPFFCHVIMLPPTILVIFAPPLHITSKKNILVSRLIHVHTITPIAPACV